MTEAFTKLNYTNINKKIMLYLQISMKLSKFFTEIEDDNSAAVTRQFRRDIDV